jgi:hypothetical protein
MAAPQMVVVFSGFRDDDLKSQIETKLNGKVTTVLSKSTTHLIIKPDAKPSQKLEKAYALGLEVNVLESFLEKHNLELVPKQKKPRAPKAKKVDDSASDTNTSSSGSESEPEHEEKPVQIVTSDNESSDASTEQKKPKKQKKMIDPEVLALKIKIAAMKKELAELQGELKAKTAKK